MVLIVEQGVYSIASFVIEIYGGGDECEMSANEGGCLVSLPLVIPNVPEESMAHFCSGSHFPRSLARYGLEFTAPGTRLS
jgi:hypothetical protein